jgi:hypothetical protein
VVSKDHYLGRCTVCLGTSAHRPVFDLSVCLQPVYLSLFYRFDWLANPIACISFSRLAQSPSIDSLDSELWYRFWTQSRCIGTGSTLGVGQSFRQLSPRGALSKGDQQPDGGVVHNQKP